MNEFTLNIQRFAAFMVSLFLVTYLFIVGKPILAPLIFAAFLAFLLNPIAGWLEKGIGNRPVSILLSMLVVITPVLSVVAVFGVQLGEIIGDLDNIRQQLNQGVEQVFRWSAGTFGMQPSELENWAETHFSTLTEVLTQVLTVGIGSSAYLFGATLLCLISIFFFLLYRTSFYNFFIYQFGESTRDQASLMIHRVGQITKEYLNGLILVILILAVLNSLGLYFIGIEMALFWGVLGACLAIIPYVGTTLGGLFPFLYAMATTGTLWQPIAVVLLYGFVQSIEGNFITPKVVGKSVRINPFIAILALVIGGALWGIAGMILSLPMIAVTKIIFSNVDVLMPVSELLRDDLYEREAVFADKYDDNRYRIFNFFRRLK